MGETPIAEWVDARPMPNFPFEDACRRCQMRALTEPLALVPGADLFPESLELLLFFSNRVKLLRAFRLPCLPPSLRFFSLPAVRFRLNGNGTSSRVRRSEPCSADEHRRRQAIESQLATGPTYGSVA